MPRCRNSATNKSRVSIISWASVVPNAIAPEWRKVPETRRVRLKQKYNAFNKTLYLAVT